MVVLKGRQNYLCRKQLQSFGPMLLRDPRDEAAFEALQPWLAETETGDRAELPIEPSEALWAELAVGVRPLRRPSLHASTRPASPRLREPAPPRPSS